MGCGRMGATIDDEIVGHHNEFLWVPFSHAAAVLSCRRTHLVAVSDVIEEKAKIVKEMTGYRHQVPAQGLSADDEMILDYVMETLIEQGAISSPSQDAAIRYLKYLVQNYR